MGNFDDLKRQAEQIFGKNAVEKIERELRNRSSQSDDSVRLDSIVNVEGVKFYPGQEKETKRDTERSKEVGENISSYVTNKNELELERIKTQSNPEHARGSSAAERLLTEAVKGEYRYGMLGLILGIASIIGGMILCLNGVAGATSWTAKLLGLESKINDAAPGVVLFIVGVFFVWITKPKVKMKDLQG